MLGLDSRFSRDIVHGVVCLAFDVLEELGEGGGVRSRPPNAPPSSAPPFGRFDSGSTPPALASTLPTEANVNDGASQGKGATVVNVHRVEEVEVEKAKEGLRALDSYDEATRLEAEALFGSTRRRRPSDPLGEESRRARVLYFYR